MSYADVTKHLAERRALLDSFTAESLHAAVRDASANGPDYAALAFLKTVARRVEQRDGNSERLDAALTDMTRVVLGP